MSIAGSIAGESVYYEEPYSVPGPCRTCCIKCPCPSILATLAFLGGVALFCLAAVLAGEQSRVLFRGTNIDEDIDLWVSNIAIACYVEVTVMAILALALLSISCLGTGSVRKEFMWRFRSRAMGRCQTGIFMIVGCFLFLLWLGQALVSLVPVVFFYIQRRGMCEARRLYDPDASPPQEKPCIDLKQWALDRPNFNDVNNPDGNLICDEQLNALCNSNVLLWFSLAFFATILVTLSMLLFLVNFAANFAKLRDRFKDGFVNRKSGAYLVRSGSVRGSRHSVGPRSSLRGSRNNVLRASKAKGSARAAAVNSGNGVPTQNGANSTASTLRMTAYQNSALDGSGDDLYAMRQLNNDILEYDREPIATLQNYNAGPPSQPPAYGSSRGLDEPPASLSVAGHESSRQNIYSLPQANGRTPSHASSSVSGNASGNYPANAKMNTLDYNRDVAYKRDDYYPSSSNFNLKPTNYNDSGNLDAGEGSVHGSVQAGDASDGAYGGDRWGYSNNYGEERNRRPLSTFSDPEPAPSMSGASDRGPLRGFNEYYL